MESTIDIVAKPVLVVRVVDKVRNKGKAALVGIKNGFLYAAGQLATGAFWKSMVKIAVEQMMSAFAMTLGGKFLTYGKQRENQEIRKAAQSMEGTGPNAAFSGGYQPRTNYNGYGFNSSQQAVGSSFPGMT